MALPIRSMIRRLKHRLSVRRAPTFYSFERPLIELVKLIEPNRVVEFGPGFSTDLFLKHSEAEIWSLETERKWYDRYEGAFDPTRVHLIYEQDGRDVADLKNQVETASLVFIDGADRLDALSAAYELSGTDGVVYLHDAHREEYEPGIKRFPFAFFPERHSCILCRDEQLHRRIKEAVGVDLSCACQYCSSPERRAYFDRMSAS